MQPTELLAMVHERALHQAPPRGPKEAARERLRNGCARFFAKVPELPVYLRKDDPMVAQAVALRDEGAEVLTLGLAFQRAEGRDPEVQELLKALEAHLVVLCLLAEARLPDAEEAWEKARELEREALASQRRWKRTGIEARPVFDPTSGVSRYDPAEAPALEVRLCCPSCRMPSQYAFGATSSEQKLSCSRCRSQFLVFFGEVRSARSWIESGTRTYAVEFDELGGPVSRVEFNDTNAEELSLTRGDLIGLTYTLEHQLRCVQNLSSGRLLWVSRGGPCFLATAVYGEDAPELEAFRRFRDTQLLPRRSGRVMVRAYYAVGPTLAKWVAPHARVRRTLKVGLDVLHRKL